nr:BTB/POZ domain-containing protein 7-like [Ciona intestinalis]|eukprot:XP_002122494.1 BTB/POZ domain-containing protein 7-like [Ciona intestinalis]
MTGSFKKSLLADKKSKSGLSTLKKKLNLPKIYKRLASKLSIHGRHLRALTSSWSYADIQCLVSQYQLVAMLKELSDAADLARKPASSVSNDLFELQKSGYLCDLHLVDGNTTVGVHSALFSKRTSMILPLAYKGVNSQAGEVTNDNGTNTSWTTLNPENAHICLNTPNITYKYSTSTRTVSISSNTDSPTNHAKELLLTIYGQKKTNIKNRSLLGKLTSNKNKVEPMKKLPNQPDFLPDTPQQQVKCEDTLELAISAAGKLTLDSREETNDEQSEFLVDMKNLMLSAGSTGDIRLVFSLASLPSRLRTQRPGICCHSFVLSARSPFLHRVIQSHKERIDEGEFHDIPFLTIEVDWKVFSPRYFPVAIHAMYTDEVDLQRVMKDIAPPVSRNSVDLVSEEGKDLTELILIGRFLEFPRLVQKCEDMLVERLNTSNVVEILRWSNKPHGSQWVERQTIRFARENFQQILSAGVYTSFTEEEFCRIIRSDFVNSPELDILRGVLKWGEHELVRQIELREPNLVRSHMISGSQSARNFRVSSVLSTRRRELLLAGNTGELHECTAALLTHVRIRHVLPSNHEALVNAVKRGVISCPPEHLLEWHHNNGTTNDNQNTFFWLRDKSGLGFSPPRYFPPHLQEAKMILEERATQEITPVNLRSVRAPLHQITSVPDALYMVNKVSHDIHRYPVTSLATKRLKYIASSYPVPHPSITSRLIARERILRQSVWIKQVLQSCHSTSAGIPHCCGAGRNSLVETNTSLCNLCRAEQYIRLLVVREADLSDIATDVLRRPHLYYDPDDLLSPPEVSSEVVKPKRLQKLFQKRVPLEQLTSSVAGWSDDETSSVSSCDSNDSNPEWPFPYNDCDMARPGNLFWDSDSSLTKALRHGSVPDVAASADSTLKLSRSSSDSESSNSLQQIPEVPSSSSRKKLSYAHYLSMKRPTRTSSNANRSLPNWQNTSSSLPPPRSSLSSPLPQLVLDGTLPKIVTEKPDLYPTGTESVTQTINQHNVQQHTNAQGAIEGNSNERSVSAEPGALFLSPQPNNEIQYLGDKETCL